jgi:hypothetical protein
MDMPALSLTVFITVQDDRTSTASFPGTLLATVAASASFRHRGGGVLSSMLDKTDQWLQVECNRDNMNIREPPAILLFSMRSMWGSATCDLMLCDCDLRPHPRGNKWRYFFPRAIYSERRVR